MVYVQLCRTADVEIGDFRQFAIRGIEVLVVHMNADQFFCLAARCTHAGAPLAEGELNGDVLTCPWHGSRFNVRDGFLLRGPAEKPLKVYNSVVKENALLIDL